MADDTSRAHRPRRSMSSANQTQGTGTPGNIQLRWSDRDVNGHLHHVRILRLIEEARIRVTQQWTATTPGSSGPKRVVRALTTSFEQEVHYGKDTTVWVWIPRIGNSLFVFGHLLTQDGEPCVYTEATMVIVDADTGVPQAHDDATRRALELHAGPAYSAHAA